MSIAISVLSLIIPILLLLKHHDITRSLVLGRALRLKVSERAALENFKRDRTLLLGNLTMFAGMETGVIFGLLYGDIPAPYPLAGIVLGVTATVVGLALYTMGMVRLYARIFGSGR